MPSYFTPAWQESRSGVKAKQVIQIAREFAQNAAENERSEYGNHGWWSQPLVQR